MRYASRLGIEDVARPSREDRDQRHSEDNDTNAPLPLHQTTQEEDASREMCHTVEGRCPRRRKARDRLKERRTKVSSHPTREKRYRSYEREQEPSECNGQHTLTSPYSLGGGERLPEPPKRSTYRKANNRRKRIGPRRLAIVNAYDKARQHRQDLKVTDLAEDGSDEAVMYTVHRQSLLKERAKLLYRHVVIECYDVVIDFDRSVTIDHLRNTIT